MEQGGCEGKIGSGTRVRTWDIHVNSVALYHSTIPESYCIFGPRPINLGLKKPAFAGIVFSFKNYTCGQELLFKLLLFRLFCIFNILELLVFSVKLIFNDILDYINTCNKRYVYCIIFI